jgi:hypothetical protein
MKPLFRYTLYLTSVPLIKDWSKRAVFLKDCLQGKRVPANIGKYGKSHVDILTFPDNQLCSKPAL